MSNGDPAWTKQITAGNERVLQGRIEDAEFSFEKDKVTGLEAMAAQLGQDRVPRQGRHHADKTERLVALVRYLGEQTGAPGDARERALEAARLAKADQVSVMVREFADLEGVMGETYALMEGHHPEVAQALREQFLPDAAGGVVPETVPGALLATAEKVDNIVAAFACGEPPSGSKDPYGLRRAAAGMVAIAAKHGLRYDVEKLVSRAYDGLERFPGLVDARRRWCRKLRRSSSSGWPRALTDDGIVARHRGRGAAHLARLPRPARPRRGPARVPGSRAWEDLVTVFTRPSNLAKKLPAEAAGGSRSSRRRSSSGGRSALCMGMVAGGRRGRRSPWEAQLHAALWLLWPAAPVRGPVLRRRAGDGRRRGRAAQPAAPAGRHRRRRCGPWPLDLVQGD